MTTYPRMTQYTELVVGEGHPSLSDVDNRPLKDVIASAGWIYPENYGAVGDGITDDTAHLQNAENARTAGQTLKGLPGKTYLCTQTSAANLLKINNPGVWDFTGATIKYGGGSNLTTGADGGSLGLVNILANNVEFRGTLDGNAKAYYPLSIKSQVIGVHLHITIQGMVDNSSPWIGLHMATSSDVTGVAISGRALNMSGFVFLPACPVTNIASFPTVTGHVAATALLVASGTQAVNSSGAALVFSSDGFTCFFSLLDAKAVQNTPSLAETSGHWIDFVVNDLGTNGLELYGEAAATHNDVGLPNGAIPGMRIKSGTNVAWYHYNVTNASTTPPNISMQGMSVGNNAAAQQGFGYIAGQFEIGSVVCTDGANVAIDLSKGNRFYLSAAAGRTISNPTNVPTNPTGLVVSQRFTITIKNNTGGAITTTFSANYHLAGAWVDPAAGKQRSVLLEWDVAAGLAYEVSRSAADVTP